MVGHVCILLVVIIQLWQQEFSLISWLTVGVYTLLNMVEDHLRGSRFDY